MEPPSRDPSDRPPPPSVPPPPPSSSSDGLPAPDARQAADWPPPPPDAAPSKVGQPAAWWRRVIAYFVDGLIVGAPLVVLGISLGLAEFVRDGDMVRFEAQPLLLMLSVAATVGYSALMDGGPRQASVGKMAMRVLVADADTGGAIGPRRAALRRLVYLGLFYAFVIPGVVNALSPLWDRRRQAFHDRAVRSVVVNAPA
ncbi:MAG: RDD family protein [Actinomycetota bacterium]